jgi:hypothetical protein
LIDRVGVFLALKRSGIALKSSFEILFVFKIVDAVGGSFGDNSLCY